MKALIQNLLKAGQTKTGILLAFGAILSVLLLLIYFRSNSEKPSSFEDEFLVVDQAPLLDPPMRRPRPSGPAMEEFERPSPAPIRVQNQPQRVRTAPPAPPPPSAELAPKRVVLHHFSYVPAPDEQRALHARSGESLADSSNVEQGSGRRAIVDVPAFDDGPPVGFAPFGRMVQAKLVMTIDSAGESQSPIIGLVGRDIFWNGRLIIPANTEVHGRTSRIWNGRVLSERDWVLVMPAHAGYPAGREWIVRGIALNRDDRSMDGAITFGVSDGALGISGEVIRTQDMDELKLFAAVGLAAASNALQDRVGLATGQTVPDATVRNAGLEAGSEIMREYAARIREEIRLYGSFTRVLAGKQFYLYIEEFLEPTKATVGASRDRLDEVSAAAATNPLIEPLQRAGAVINPLAPSALR